MKKSLETEEISRNNARRSLVAMKDITKGEVIKENHFLPGKGQQKRYLLKI